MDWLPDDADDEAEGDTFESEFFRDVLHWALARTSRVYIAEPDQSRSPLRE
ncbi:hypothetical protein [Sciscionella sediminilitoris]|uniref:hypothetical protein n=1 Tax=Sciscionella sediminilitoris TaxID=1445613 RepID=UPI0012E2CF50|nr:hypothetical protein [Sciscionella sp. SE31]